MPREGSVTRWIDHLMSGGSETALKALWLRYYPRATQQVRGLMARGWRWHHPDDAEDVAQSAVRSLIGRVAQGRLVVRDGRRGWERLLAVITRHKASHRMRRRTPSIASIEPEVLAAAEPAPAQQAEMEDRLESLLGLLGEPTGTLRRIAELTMENYTQNEIAEKLGVTRRTVARKLVLIRKRLGPELGIPSTNSRDDLSGEEV